MKQLIVCAMVLTVFAACGKKQEPAPESPRYEGKILAAGTSLTSGFGLPEQAVWTHLVEQELVQRGTPYQVINAGVDGETSAGLLARIEWLMQQKPDIVIIETGANDALRGKDPKDTANNINNIITAVKKGSPVIILAGMQSFENMGADYARRFKAIYAPLAAKHRVLFMPFFLKDVATVPELNKKDGIHPNEKGQRILAKNIMPYILSAIKKQRELQRNGKH